MLFSCEVSCEVVLQKCEVLFKIFEIFPNFPKHKNAHKWLNKAKSPHFCGLLSMAGVAGFEPCRIMSTDGLVMRFLNCRGKFCVKLG